MVYKFEQAGNIGMVEAKSLKEAEQKAKNNVPYNPAQYPVNVAKAGENDLAWFEGMGGIVDK